MRTALHDDAKKDSMETVTVKFVGEVSPEHQAVALMAFEKHLRALTKQDVRVFKALKGDDSKLRVMMTPAQRDKL